MSRIPGLLAVADEIEARDEAFFATNVLTLGERALRDDLVELAGPLGTTTPEDTEEVALATLEHRGIRWEVAAGDHDPVMAELLVGMRDAGRVDVWRDGADAPDPDELPSIDEVLATRYRPIADAAGVVRGHVRLDGRRPVLLLNALGLPLRVWTRFLVDDHDLQVVVPVLPCCDLVDGGMTETMSAPDVAASVHELLGLLGTPVDVLAWCNSGRIALELAALAGPGVERIVLVAPSFREGPDSTPTSVYEDDIDRLFGLVAADSARAPLVAGMLARVGSTPDWAALAAEPERRGEALFALPRQIVADDLRTPMVDPASLVHYVARTYLDEAATSAMGPGPGARTTLIQGAHDAIVSNAHTTRWMEDNVPGFTGYEISGSGHYVHDLQYEYLRLLLVRTLLGAGDEPVGPDDLPARVRAVHAAQGAVS
jgi:pimeloyl-ACP methyl ester carboxylesterase